MNIVTKLVIGFSTLFALIILAIAAVPGNAATIDRSPDCDKYAVMYCGSFTKKEIIKKLNNGDGQNSSKNIKGIYELFGLSAKRIDNDKFVKGVVYRNGNVKVDGKIVATNAKTYIRHLGGRVSTSKMGSAQEALVHINKKGVFEYAVMTPCGNPVTGKPVLPPTPTPVPPTPTPVPPTPTPVPPTPTPVPKPESISCDVMQVVITNKKTRSVEAKVMGNALNTTISGYKVDFGDGTVVNEQTATHNYADYGTYTIVAHVSGQVNGTTQTVTSPTCAKTVEFNEPPKPLEQALACDALTLDLFNVDKKYVKVTVTGSAQNTTIDDYKIDFGDGTVVNEQTAEHTYADFEEYTIKAYVSGKIKEEVVVVGGEGNCVQTVEFKENIEPCPTNPALPIDDPNCKPCPTNPDLNYDDPNCKEPEVPVTPELPNTGAGAMVGLFGGVSILGAISHRIWLTRKIGM